MKRRFALTAPIVREPQLHKAVADVLRLELGGPGRISRYWVTWWSVDMSNFADLVPGLRTGRGCIAGVPDLMVLWQGRAFFIELKAEDGVLSKAQQDVALTIELTGNPFGVARNWEQVLALLDAWGIPRNHRVS